MRSDDPDTEANDGGSDNIGYSQVDPEEYDWDEPFNDPPQESASPLIVGGAVVGVLVGLFLWGSIMLSAVSGITGIFDDSSPSTSEPADSAPATENQVEAIDCDAFGPTRTLSADREAAYQAQCVTPEPEPESTPDAPPSDATLNRESCDAIRGTEYRSVEERQWFLANCVN